VETIKNLPVLGSILTVLDTYPRLSAWVVLSVGIVALLFYEARDVGLSTGNWIALIIASIVVAGLCIWIVSWEDETEAETLVVKSEAKPAESGEKPAATE
jgi:K+ transporter